MWGTRRTGSSCRRSARLESDARADARWNSVFFAVGLRLMAPSQTREIDVPDWPVFVQEPLELHKCRNSIMENPDVTNWRLLTGNLRNYARHPAYVNVNNVMYSFAASTVRPEFALSLGTNF